MKLAFSTRAERDLRALGDWIAEDNPVRAISFIDELREACRGLLQYPRAYPAVPGFPELRRRLHGRYLIFYRVEVDRVVIVAVRHGALDQENWLENPEAD